MTYAQIYKSLEPVSEQEAEMLFPGSTTATDWFLTEAASRLYGVSDEGVLHVFVRRYTTSDLYADELAQELDELNWLLYTWQENTWTFAS